MGLSVERIGQDVVLTEVVLRQAGGLRVVALERIMRRWWARA
jgi:hypothetical protein